jgi:MFS family permease
MIPTPGAGDPQVSTPGLRQYLIVTASYWGFTLTDGALRMLVLLHFFKLGYSPFTLALLFLLYEAAGILANLVGGWLATRFGIARMLMVGLLTQILGFLLLSAMSPDWSATLSVAWVVMAQGVCGVAKDLTKTASKSAIKLTAGGASGRLFKWVAWFTGSKNAMKGVGFFLGGLLLEGLGFQGALWLMAGLLGLVLLGVVFSLSTHLGRAKPSKSAKELFSKSQALNLLAASRLALFGARDVWFVVGVPVFFYSQGWTFPMVGGFMAAWTIGYGLVQGLAPQLVPRSNDGLSREVLASRTWAFGLALVPVAMVYAIDPSQVQADLWLVLGLSLFGLAFAVNSSVHSYLVLAYAGSERAAEDVGFYYAANAAGRFLGTLLSGWLYGAGGITACLWGSASLLVVGFFLSLGFPRKVSQLS